MCLVVLKNYFYHHIDCLLITHHIPKTITRFECRGGIQMNCDLVSTDIFNVIDYGQITM